MIDLAEQVGMIEPGELLPTGMIVGSAILQHARRVCPSLLIYSTTVAV